VGRHIKNAYVEGERANVIVCGNGAALPSRRLTGREHGVPFR